MLDNLKISIITPSFNQGQYIEECILSVINQNYPNVEHIIIDGGSTDNTVDIIKKYEQRITYWISEKDSGQSEAINKGLNQATGDIVTWLNSDDLYLPESLNKVENLFRENKDVKLIHGSSVLFGVNFKEKLIKSPENGLTERYLAYIPFPQPSSFFKRDILSSIGLLDEHLHYGMDYDLLVRIALNYFILKTDEVFSNYRLHSESKTKNGLGFAKEWSIIFSKVLRSIPKTEQMIISLTKINLYNKGEDFYSVSLPVKNIKLSFLYFLNIQMHCYYNSLNLKKATEIALLIKETDELFYKKEKVKKVFSKANYLHPSVISILRNFTRK